MALYDSHGEEETAAIAAGIAARARAGDVFLLEGPLGAGKSVFARAFIRALCGKDTDVPSPTFTLVQTYETGIAPLWHFDLYRLEDPEEIFELGWEDRADAICLIEWPERLGPHKPARTRTIRITSVGAQTRKISIDDTDDR